jgi:DNA-binding beta-propeller fold protein YncE
MKTRENVSRLGGALVAASLVLQSTAAVAATAWAGRDCEDAVSIIDTIAGAEVDSAGPSDLPSAIVLNNAQTRVFVLENGSISAIDTATNDFIDTVAVPSLFGEIAIGPTDSYVYATDWNAGLFVVSTVGLTLTTTVSLSGASDVVANPAGGYVYVARTIPGEPFPVGAVTRVETTGHTSAGNLTMGLNVYALAISPSGDRLYAFVADLFTVYISVIDTATFTPIDTIEVVDDVYHMEVNPAGDRLYALGSLGVSVFTLPSGTFVTTVPLSGGNAMTMYPNGGSLLISRNASDEIAVMSTATNTLIDTIAVDCPSGLDVGDEDVDGDGVLDPFDNCWRAVNADQLDTDRDGFGNLCDADFDQSCNVDFTDLGELKGAFFQTGLLVEDMNGDGSVNFADLGLFKPAMFLPPGPSGVPNICDD